MKSHVQVVTEPRLHAMYNTAYVGSHRWTIEDNCPSGETVLFSVFHDWTFYQRAYRDWQKVRSIALYNRDSVVLGLREFLKLFLEIMSSDVIRGAVYSSIKVLEGLQYLGEQSHP